MWTSPTWPLTSSKPAGQSLWVPLVRTHLFRSGAARIICLLINSKSLISNLIMEMKSHHIQKSWQHLKGRGCFRVCISGGGNLGGVSGFCLQRFFVIAFLFLNIAPSFCYCSKLNNWFPRFIPLLEHYTSAYLTWLYGGEKLIFHPLLLALTRWHAWKNKGYGAEKVGSL